MKITFSAKSFIDAINKSVDAVTKELSNVVFKDIKRRSPVGKTGRFKNSWTKYGSGKKYTISNSQPYGPALEAGRSSKAPDGVVGPAIKKPITIRR